MLKIFLSVILFLFLLGLSVVIIFVFFIRRKIKKLMEQQNNHFNRESNTSEERTTTINEQEGFEYEAKRVQGDQFEVKDPSKKESIKKE